MLKKKLYRELSMSYHPDVGGNADIFKKINALYNKNNPQAFFEYYEQLTGKSLGLENRKRSSDFSYSSFSGSETGWGEYSSYTPKGSGRRGYPKDSFGGTRYPSSLQGVVDSWADLVIDRIERIQWIENIAVGNVEIKVDIDWVKTINGKFYKLKAHLNGKFFDYQSYIEAVMNAVEGSINELSYRPTLERK